jgi:ubiquinone/menaquinone biosynthesis C-methylase UbiE
MATSQGTTQGTSQGTSQGTTAAKLFDRWSQVYDRPRFQEAMYRPVHDAVLTRLANTQPEVVLDLGCGTGNLTLRLMERFPSAHVIGLDYSEGMLEQAAVRLRQGASLVRSDAQCLPFRPASVDVAVCTESFHWYPNQQQALLGLAVALRPGGHLVIASISTVTEFGDAAVRVLSTAGGQPVAAVTPKRLRTMLARAGLEVVHQQRVPRLAFAPWPMLTHAQSLP